MAKKIQAKNPLILNCSVRKWMWSIEMVVIFHVISSIWRRRRRWRRSILYGSMAGHRFTHTFGFLPTLKSLEISVFDAHQIQMNTSFGHKLRQNDCARCEIEQCASFFLSVNQIFAQFFIKNDQTKCRVQRQRCWRLYYEAVKSNRSVLFTQSALFVSQWWRKTLN